MRQNKFRGNVFVANLPKGFDDAQLASAFDPYGIVIGAFLARDPGNGAILGHGLVDIAPSQAAERAVTELNGIEIGGRKIEVRLADPEMALTIPTPPRPAASAYPRANSYDDRPRYGNAAAEYAPRPERRPVQVEYRSIPRRSI